MSYFWKERAHDGLLSQPALLTPDHRRLRFSYSKRWCLPILQKTRPRILFQISSGVVFLSPWTRFASTCLIYLVTSAVSQKAFLTSLRDKKEQNLLLPIKGGRLGVQRDWSVFNPSMGYMCRRRDQARWQNRSRMRGIVVCRGYCGCWRRYRCFILWWFLPVWLLDVRARGHLWEGIKDKRD